MAERFSLSVVYDSSAGKVAVRSLRSVRLESRHRAALAIRAVTRSGTLLSEAIMVDDAAGLERKFDAAMLDIYHGAARLGYRPTRFLEMVQVYGGVETAHRLLATDKVQDGLGELFLLGRLDLTVEHHVPLPEFAPLFSDHERAVARARLGIEGGEEASQ
jgi:hypothetical protein